LQTALVSQQAKGEASDTNIGDLQKQLKAAETDLGAFGELANRIKTLEDATVVLKANPVLTQAQIAKIGQDPTGWTLKGSNDGTTWATLDTRTNQTFTWQRQTRPFALKTPASYARYRLEFSGTNAVSLAEFELLGMPDAAPAPVAVVAPTPPPVTSAG
jgi:hypothetical protein